MLDLLVINPNAAHGIYGSDLANNLIAVEPPLWCRIIAAYVCDRHFDVKIADMEAGVSIYKVLEIIHNEQPRLICIAVYGHQPSASTQQMYGARIVADQLRTAGVVEPIIMVGGHVAALPERTLREEPIDYAASGDGLTTILGLLYNKDKSSVPGLVWTPDSVREGASVYTPVDQRRIQINPHIPADVDDMHGDCWDLLPMDRYRAHNWQCLDGWPRSPYAAIASTFNCPYKCSFCCISAPFGNNIYKRRDPALVVREMEYLYHEHGVRTFKIVDEMFILNEKHYTAIAQKLVDNGMGDRINIWAYARVDTVAAGHLPLLRRAGFRWLALGIESASKFVRDGSNKRLKNDDIIGVVRTIQNYGINVIGNFIFGLPDDTSATMEETLGLALACECDWANFYCAMAYPGSHLYTLAVKQNKPLPDEWAGYSQHNAKCRPLDTDHITAAEVLRFRDAAFTRFFGDHEYLRRINKKFGAAAVRHIQEMSSFKLKRNLLEAA